MGIRHLRLRFIISALSLAAPAWTQVVGASISGAVRDSSGQPLPGATVVLTDKETNALRSLITDANGHYVAPSIAIGAYTVQASKEGFESQVKSGIQLVVGQSQEVDLTLQVGEVRQVVTVEEAPDPVAVSTEDTSGLVNERQVKELPLNGRSYDQLLTLNPATVNYTSQRSGGVGTSNSSVGNMFAVSGHRPQENLFLLNGIEFTGASEINNTPGGASGELLGVDAVREFNVVSDSYGAEYGKRPGAQVSIVTASGTNQLHGSAYEFLRNNALDARNFFDGFKIPQFQRNEFGAALGGPIKKNKLFVFGNYEGFRQHLGLSDVTLVPDNNARAHASPAAAPLLALWPVQNGPSLGGGIAYAYSNPLQTIREDFGTTRLDYTISDRDTLSGVYTIDDSAANTPTVNPLSGVIETLREQVASAQEQHVFSSRVFNTARFGFSRAGYFFTGTTPADLPGWVDNAPIGAVVVGGGTALNGASQISLAGTNAGSNLSAVRNLFTFDNHISINHGIHQIEAGIWLQRLQANDNLAQYQYGQASFGSLASFLAGKVSTFTVIPSPTPLGWRSLEGAGFVEDSIRPAHNFQLKIGFRFESTNGWNEVHGRGANYLFQNGIIETNPRIASSVFTVNRAKFLPLPRFGFSWDPFGKSKTVINGGFGIYRMLLDNLDYRLDQTAPFNTTQSSKNVLLSQLHNLPRASGLISPSGVQPDAYTPTILTWTFKIQQQIAPNTVFSAGYVGSHGYHEMLSLDANEPPLLNPKLANTTSWFSEGISSYNALTLDVNRRFSNGLQFRGVYTFSKGLDDGTAWNSSVASNAPGFVMYPLNPKLDYGRSTTDVRHLAAVNATYELPFKRNRLVSGWSVSAIQTVQSGLPFTPQLGFNPTGNSDTRNPIRPSWNAAFTGPIVLGSPQEYFNPAAFVIPPNREYGNAGRDVLTGPGLVSLDISALKNTNLTESVRLQFRAEFFNALNHANFSTPNPVVFASASPAPSPTAGVITATSTTSRQIQFGLKLLF